MNEIGAVVHGLDAHAFRQTARDLGDALLDAADDVERVLAVARHGDAGHHFALAIELGDTAALVGTELDAGDLADSHRRAAVRLEHELGDVVRTAQVTHAAHHVLGLGHLDDSPAHVAVAVANHLPTRSSGMPKACSLRGSTIT